MQRKETYPLQKVTLNLRNGDWNRLQFLHPRDGAGKAIRRLVIKHLRRVEDGTVPDQRAQAHKDLLP